jgi:hypothetical protein
LYAREVVEILPVTSTFGRRTESDVFVVNVTFCLIASVLLTLVVTQAELVAGRGHLLADAEIAAGRSAVWSGPVLTAHRTEPR